MNLTELHYEVMHRTNVKSNINHINSCNSYELIMWVDTINVITFSVSVSVNVRVRKNNNFKSH